MQEEEHMYKLPLAPVTSCRRGFNVSASLLILATVLRKRRCTKPARIYTARPTFPTLAPRPVCYKSASRPAAVAYRVRTNRAVIRNKLRFRRDFQKRPAAYLSRRADADRRSLQSRNTSEP